MLTKRNFRRFIALLGVMALAFGMMSFAGAEEALEQPVLNPHVKSIIEADGYQFIDLNGNGALDPYEDWRLDADTRTEDLVGQMTVREKIAQMQHPTYLPRDDGKIAPYLEKYCTDYGIGMLLIRELNSVQTAADTMNALQEYATSSGHDAEYYANRIVNILKEAGVKGDWDIVD